jgi:hypothetical protein
MGSMRVDSTAVIDAHIKHANIIAFTTDRRKCARCFR